MDSTEHCTITARLRRFSSCDGEDSVCTKYEYDGNLLARYFEVEFYANGSCVEIEGHVSIVFNFDYLCLSRKPTAFSCTASVIDASGNKRFPQSLALDLDYLHNEDESFFAKSFGFDKFVKRSTLLSDSPVLLPGDCLTLCLDIDFEFTSVSSCFLKDDTHGLYWENSGCYLRMDTEFGRELCKMSTVFRNMMTVESGPDQIQIAPEEALSFLFIYDFLCESELRRTLSDMCDLYLLADKYDMQPIVQLCHRLLISVWREMNTQEKLEFVDKDMHMISELAERFADDESLREILAIYSVIKKELESGSRDFDTSDACKLETEWNCEFKRRADSSFYVFDFLKKKIKHLENDIYK